VKLRPISKLAPIIAKISDNELSYAKIDNKKIPAYCGYQKEWGILKFKVLADTAEFKKGEFLLTMIECPRERIEMFGMENFKNNQKYLLTIGGRVDRNDGYKKAVEMYSKKENENLSLFWFTDFKELK
jgi:hypothetical protein